ncbi:hypothetical protein Bca4012_058537 [Brassica carinata]
MRLCLSSIPLLGFRAYLVCSDDEDGLKRKAYPPWSLFQWFDFCDDCIFLLMCRECPARFEGFGTSSF